LIPRFPNDGLKHWPGEKYREGEIEEWAQKIREIIKKSS